MRDISSGDIVDMGFTFSVSVRVLLFLDLDYSPIYTKGAPTSQTTAMRNETDAADGQFCASRTVRFDLYLRQCSSDLCGNYTIAFTVTMSRT